MHHHHQNASKFVTIYHNQPKEEARLYAEAGFLCWWCAIILNRLNLVVFCAVCLWVFVIDFVKSKHTIFCTLSHQIKQNFYFFPAAFLLSSPRLCIEAGAIQRQKSKDKRAYYAIVTKHCQRLSMLLSSSSILLISIHCIDLIYITSHCLSLPQIQNFGAFSSNNKENPPPKKSRQNNCPTKKPPKYPKLSRFCPSLCLFVIITAKSPCGWWFGLILLHRFIIKKKGRNLGCRKNFFCGVSGGCGGLCWYCKAN